MKLNKHQKRFIAVASIAAAVTICSHINIPELAHQSNLEPNDTGLLTLVATKQASQTPEEIGRACLPPNEADGAELVGEYQNPTSTQLFQVWNLQITSHHTVLRVHGLYGVNGPYGLACLPAYDERYNKTIGDDLSEEDAQQVALVIWQYRTNLAGGVEAVQTGFNNEALELAQYGELGYLSVEDKWALETIGIQVPDIYVIYDPENPPQLPRPTRGEI